MGFSSGFPLRSFPFLKRRTRTHYKFTSLEKISGIRRQLLNGLTMAFLSKRDWQFELTIDWQINLFHNNLKSVKYSVFLFVVIWNAIKNVYNNVFVWFLSILKIVLSAWQNFVVFPIPVLFVYFSYVSNGISFLTRTFLFKFALFNAHPFVFQSFFFEFDLFRKKFPI